MKKIGILTYIKEYANIGTNMQSYSTLQALKKAYTEAHVELINYSGWKPVMKPYLSDISFHSLTNDITRIRKYRKFFKDDLILGKNKLISSNLNKSLEFIKKQNYSAIYVGADTVLELKKAHKDSLTAYWLDNTVNCKKFLIAASSNNVVYDTLTIKQIDEIQKTIDGFSLLGVRDEPTYRLLSNFVPKSDKRLKIIPDPTFTYEIDYSYVEQYIRRKKLHFNKPVVCLHLLRDSKWAWDLSNDFRKAGFIIASLRPAYYADIILTDLSPFEQLGLYKYFKLVITHRFHDSIFCLKNLTPVIFFPEHVTDVTLYRESKTLTIFKAFKLEKTNYIENKENITARHIFEMHHEAIASFEKNKDFIKNTLYSQKEKYESFINESKKLCVE